MALYNEPSLKEQLNERGRQQPTKHQKQIWDERASEREMLYLKWAALGATLGISSEVIATLFNINKNFTTLPVLIVAVILFAFAAKLYPERLIATSIEKEYNKAKLRGERRNKLNQLRYSLRAAGATYIEINAALFALTAAITTQGIPPIFTVIEAVERFLD